MSGSFKALYRNKWSGAIFVLVGDVAVHLRLGQSWVMQEEGNDVDE